ncbi:MAG: PglZ domain-containing protein, partial [bacterium]
MKKINILWVDDEIELLRPYIIFLEEKGYVLETASNGEEAIKKVLSHTFDLIFLDENMPGLTGLDTLNRIKFIFPNLPIIMITKSEEENIMEEAIGSKIADYLIKPVNPNQILLAIKKNIDTKWLVDQKTTRTYQSEFSKISMDISSAGSFEEWVDIYKKLVYWDLEIERSNEESVKEIMEMQKQEANNAFSKYIQSSYKGWFTEKDANKPILSPSLLKNKVFPLLENNQKMVFILIDNLRYDQWKTISSYVTDYMNIEQEEMYCSILPTATQYARNAIFAGLMPFEIQKLYPHLWLEEDEDESKNMNEEELLKIHLARLGKKVNYIYKKINNLSFGKKVFDNFNNLLNHDFIVLVYNFIDMLSHARTEIEMIRELTNNDSAYRSITQSWFRHSHLLDMIRMFSENNVKVVITTDHGSIRVNNPVKVIGDRETSTNLRYKQGKTLSYNQKDVFA